jgi:hypothetical protein
MLRGMSLSKAYKDIVAERNTPEFQEYMVALFKYKDECKRFNAVKRVLKDKDSAMERLQLFDAQHRHRKACQVFYAARKVYESHRIKMRIGSLSEYDLQRLLEIEIPQSLTAIVSEGQQVAPIVTMTEEQRQSIIHGAMESEKRSRTARESFIIHEGERNDPTLNDDAPLPE